MKTLLVTGSSGLIGSAVSSYFGSRGWAVHGIDNNQRAVFFGPAADTRWNCERLLRELPRFTHHELDIRDRAGLRTLVRRSAPNAIVHAAAQPSHNRAAEIPYDDFDTNAVGTLNLLEAAREVCPEAPFVHLSTNKVYGDRPNRIRLREEETRWAFDDPAYQNGIPETLGVDHSTHTLFGASKAAADLLVQEYGRTFTMPTCCLRGGCLSGPYQAGVEAHGFLSYLVRTNLEQREYRVFGHKGKQVRDHIHAEDVARFIETFVRTPRSGAVYNIGGGRDHSCSVLEAFALVEAHSGIPMQYSLLAEPRHGDHICYYSDLSGIRGDYPAWDLTIPLDETVRQIVEAWRTRLA